MTMAPGLCMRSEPARDDADMLWQKKGNGIAHEEGGASGSPFLT